MSGADSSRVPTPEPTPEPVSSSNELNRTVDEEKEEPSLLPEDFDIYEGFSQIESFQRIVFREEATNWGSITNEIAKKQRQISEKAIALVQDDETEKKITKIYRNWVVRSNSELGQKLLWCEKCLKVVNGVRSFSNTRIKPFILCKHCRTYNYSKCRGCENQVHSSNKASKWYFKTFATAFYEWDFRGDQYPFCPDCIASRDLSDYVEVSDCDCCRSNCYNGFKLCVYTKKK